MFEFKRSLNNKSFLIYFIMIGFSCLLGYFLPIGLDNMETVTIDQFSFSLYTVMTQFGPMIYSVAVINSINQDYRDKNILFIKHSGVTPLSYLVKKIFVNLFWFSTSIIFLYGIICLVYNDFMYFWTMIISFMSVLFYITTVSALFGFLFRNILMSYGANLLLWIVGIIVVAIFPTSVYIAYFDASNLLYQNIEKYFQTGDIIFANLDTTVLYNIIVFSMVLILTQLFNKAWLINGTT